MELSESGRLPATGSWHLKDSLSSFAPHLPTALYRTLRVVSNTLTSRDAHINSPGVSTGRASGEAEGRVELPVPKCAFGKRSKMRNMESKK